MSAVESAAESPVESVAESPVESVAERVAGSAAESVDESPVESVAERVAGSAAESAAIARHHLRHPTLSELPPVWEEEPLTRLFPLVRKDPFPLFVSLESQRDTPDTVICVDRSGQLQYTANLTCRTEGRIPQPSDSLFDEPSMQVGMRQPSENERERGPDPASDLAELVTGFVSGNRQAERNLYALLTMEADRAVRRFFRKYDLEFSSVVADSVSAVMLHIREQGGFTGRLIPFTVAVTRNRCRNLIETRRLHPQVGFSSSAHTCPAAGHNPLESLERAELLHHLQPVLNSLGRFCRSLLRAHYVEGRSMKELLKESHYKSLQGLYDRRKRCLAEALKRFMDRLGDR